MAIANPPAPPSDSGATFRRVIAVVILAGFVGLAYMLRGVLVPLFLGFLLAYALDPFVNRCEKIGIRRPLGAVTIVLGIAAAFLLLLIFGIPQLLEELGAVAADFPDQVHSLADRVEPWLWSTFHVKLPHTMNELVKALDAKLASQEQALLNTGAKLLFGTLSYVAVVLSALIVPVFALYLLIDFDRIVNRVGELIPRRWHPSAAAVALQIHRTLGGYVRGQLTANVVLAALYATGLRFVAGIGLGVPIGVFTGMMAFVPYVGFFTGFGLALAMSILDWHGIGPMVGVVIVMGGVQLLDGLVITPRIVGRSVGLAPLEVIITMMAAASLFGFLGVMLAVPLGAVVKILLQRAVRAYLASNFYRRPPSA